VNATRHKQHLLSPRGSISCKLTKKQAAKFGAPVVQPAGLINCSRCGFCRTYHFRNIRRCTGCSTLSNRKQATRSCQWHYFAV